MSEGASPKSGRAWAAVARALDELPDGVAVGVGLALGLAVFVALPWVALVLVGGAVALGLGAGVRPRAQGWGGPVVGAVAMVGVAAGLLTWTVAGGDEQGDEEPPLVIAGGEVLRLDLGDGGRESGSTGGSEESGTSTGDGSSSTGGGDGNAESTGESPGRPPRPRPQPELEADVLETFEAKDLGGGAVPKLTARLPLGMEGLADIVTSRPPGGVPKPSTPRCRSGMEFIDGGSFDGHDIEPLCLDTTEVRVSSYERCIEKGNCTEAGKESGFDGTYSKSDYCNRNHDGRGQHPMNCVDWEQARQFCKQNGKRLPTEWEWEWAARGRELAKTYPWGEEAPSCARAVMSDGGDGCGKDRTWAVGSKPKGDSRDGVKDMAGNVLEWTSSGSEERRLVRGGGWDDFFPDFFCADDRFYRREPSNRSRIVGFRCARTAAGTQ